MLHRHVQITHCYACYTNLFNSCNGHKIWLHFVRYVIVCVCLTVMMIAFSNHTLSKYITVSVLLLRQTHSPVTNCWTYHNICLKVMTDHTLFMHCQTCYCSCLGVMTNTWSDHTMSDMLQVGQHITHNAWSSACSTSHSFCQYKLQNLALVTGNQ